MTMEKVIIGKAELYLADCMDVLPTLGKVHAVVTDPPYGIGENGERSSRTKNRGRWNNPKPVDYGFVEWDKKPLDLSVINAVLEAGTYQIIFGGNYYALPPTSCWLVWDKLNGNNDFADCELAWTNLNKAVRRIQFLWNGFQRQNNEKRGDHPTQKPIGVMRWCLSHLPDDAQTILDPFMGSGTTGVAAVQMGRKFIGIEREPRYFDIACRRIEDAQRQVDIFAAPELLEFNQNDLLSECD